MDVFDLGVTYGGNGGGGGAGGSGAGNSGGTVIYQAKEGEQAFIENGKLVIYKEAGIEYFNLDHSAYFDENGVDRGTQYIIWSEKTVDLSIDANKGGSRLNPETVMQNIGGDNYTGANNPRNYDGTYNYSLPSVHLSDGPSLGHDRRYDRIGGVGLKTLTTDTRASVIDLKFVKEQLDIAFSAKSSNFESNRSFSIGIGLGLIALPKMINQSFTNPASWGQSLVWYYYASMGVTNSPSK